MKKENRDNLFFDDTPFIFLDKTNFIKDKDVIFSDIFTSFRITAYLPCYVACQHKPGVGIKDQDERRLEEVEFFEPKTSFSRMREILLKRRANWVVINSSPGYAIYGYPCGHPETITKLKYHSGLFELIYDKDDWAIFRMRQ